jgi:hypothetical protein
MSVHRGMENIDMTLHYERHASPKSAALNRVDCISRRF